MTNCLVVQHVEPESAFAIGDALILAGTNLDSRRVFAGDQLPSDLSDFDGLVVMGGPMSAASDVGFATRLAEIALLADAVRLGIPTLGVCLGAQLLASACGAAVTAGGSGPEIGWAPVDLLVECKADALFADLPEDLTVLHWHGDTFDLPIGAQRLMANSRYPNQAFRMGEAAWGLQFHLEVTEVAIEGFLTEFVLDAEQAVGGAAAIRMATKDALASLEPARDLVLGRFAALVSAARTRDPLG